MDQLVHFSPTTITFEFNPDRKTTTYLHLRNVSEHRIAYKVKTTHIKRYCVRPNAAIIEPGTEIDVELIQQALKTVPDDVDNCRDRFLLQVARLDLIPSDNLGGELCGYESVMDLWTAVPEEVTHKTKFGVILKVAEVTGEMNFEREARIVPNTNTPLNSSIRVGHEKIDVPSVPSSASASARGALSAVTSEVKSESKPLLRTFPRTSEQEEERQLPSSSIERSVMPNQGSIPTDTSTSPKPISTPHADDSKSPKDISAKSHNEIDYGSIEFVRERVLGIRTAPKIALQCQDEATRQRVAVERAGELVRTIKARQKDIDMVNRELSEARHRLSDARMVTRPAYDVKYEVNDSSRVPYAQIAIMAIISGALLQLLV